jgi:NOL1/NOP2/fmu family ribosome biogenesis protein
MDVWSSLKENGLLIYSTCTFNPAENEENINWLSEKTGASSVRLDISKFTGVNEISFKGITGYGFYPGKIIGEGLFISVVRKEGDLSKTIKHPFKRNDNQLTNSDLKIAGNLIDTSLTKLYRHDDIVYDLALQSEEYQFLKNYLRIIKGGTALFKTRNKDFSPLHDLAVSCLIRNDAFPLIELDYSQSISFLKKENLTLKYAKKGWTLLKYRGVNLGFIKNIGSRANNYFPVNWRIRMGGISIKDRNLVEWKER